MNVADVIAHLAVLVQAFADVLRHVTTAVPIIRRLLPSHPMVTYENISLTLSLDIQDADGRRAVLTRRQRLRVLTGDGITIRDLVWGEGRPLAHYRAHGATRLGVVPEGSRQVALLRLPSPLLAGEIAVVETRRRITDGLRKRQEYCEILVERPTRRVAVEIRFPHARPPKDAELITAPLRERSRRLRPRYAADGRPVLTWRKDRPAPDTLYSLRWSW